MKYSNWYNKRGVWLTLIESLTRKELYNSYRHIKNKQTHCLLCVEKNCKKEAKITAESRFMSVCLNLPQLFGYIKNTPTCRLLQYVTCPKDTCHAIRFYPVRKKKLYSMSVIYIHDMLYSTRHVQNFSTDNVHTSVLTNIKCCSKKDKH